MKLLNKFWLVAVVSVGLFSCNQGDEKSSVKDQVVEEVSDVTKDTTDGVVASIFEGNLVDIEYFGVKYKAVLASYTPIGDVGKIGFNISTNFVPGTSTTPSKIKFYVLNNTVLGNPPTLIDVANLSNRTVELTLTNDNTLSVSSFAPAHAHFSDVKAYPVSNSVDFKISLYHPRATGLTDFYIVGTEDDRNVYLRNQLMGQIKYNSTSPRKLRFSYASSSASTGTVFVSFQNTTLSVSESSCQYSATGVKEDLGWGILYNKSCKNE